MDSELVSSEADLATNHYVPSHRIDSQIPIIPIEDIAPDDEIIETYVVQDDGTLLKICDETVTEPKTLTRKRRRNVEGWKRNISKSNRQSGKVYTNCRGEIQSARRVRIEGCANPVRCPFKCMTKFSQDARQAIFNSFWALNDSEKRHFYVANVKKSKCLCKRTKSVTSQKTYNLRYYFNYMDEDIQVCQKFFANTLDVSQGRVYYYFSQNKNKPTITPGAPRHGKHTKKVLSIEQKQGVRDHINRFPTVESHYCRQNTKKKYLHQGLNLSIMYRLYLEETAKPVKFSAYRNIFNYEFNLAFFHPKKDRCDKCMAFEILTNPTKKEVDDQNLHVLHKTNAATERTKDREILPIVHEQRKSAVGAGDMENVFQVPITNASIAYYSRKFSVLSFTLVLNKTVYNAMWNEALCGREGTHIANALIKLLTRIVQDNPHLEELTLWTDSCVPQNRNSIVSAAIQRFIDSSVSHLKRIEQKFSEAGHGQIQEVDTAHSVIEKFLRGKFIYSPSGLVEEIKKIPDGKLNFVVLEMEPSDYLDYRKLADAYDYTVIPYTKVKQLNYEKNQSKIWFKYDFPDDFIERNIVLKPKKVADIEGPLNLNLCSKISTQKIADIRKMFAIMPAPDKANYENLFANLNTFDVDDTETENLGTVVKKHNKKKSKIKKFKKSEAKQKEPKNDRSVPSSSAVVSRKFVDSRKAVPLFSFANSSEYKSSDHESSTERAMAQGITSTATNSTLKDITNHHDSKQSSRKMDSDRDLKGKNK